MKDAVRSIIKKLYLEFIGTMEAIKCKRKQKNLFLSLPFGGDWNRSFYE